MTNMLGGESCSPEGSGQPRGPCLRGMGRSPRAQGTPSPVPLPLTGVRARRPRSVGRREPGGRRGVAGRGKEALGLRVALSRRVALGGLRVALGGRDALRGIRVALSGRVAVGGLRVGLGRLGVALGLRVGVGGRVGAVGRRVAAGRGVGHGGTPEVRVPGGRRAEEGWGDARRRQPRRGRRVPGEGVHVGSGEAARVQTPLRRALVPPRGALRRRPLNASHPGRAR